MPPFNQQPPQNGQQIDPQTAAMLAAQAQQQQPGQAPNNMMVMGGAAAPQQQMDPNQTMPGASTPQGEQIGNQVQVGMGGGAPGQGPSPLDILLSYSQSTDKKKKEVSLKTLKKAEIDKIMQAFDRGRSDANNYYVSVVEPKLIERENKYYARAEYYKKIFPKLSETSNFCSRDILTTIKWILPNICEPFTGPESPIDVKGVNADDDPKADKVQQLLTYELQRKNDYTVLMNFALQDALKLNYGVAKVYWRRDEEREPYKLLISQEDYQLIAILNQESSAGHIEINSIKPLPDAPDLSVVQFDKITVKANYPVVEYMSPSQLRFSSNSKNLGEAKFVAQRKLVTGDYLKRKEQQGIYSNIDEAMKKDDGEARYTTYDLLKNDELSSSNQRLSDGDNASRMFELYEAYMDVDYNNDGIYEHLIVHAIGDTPIRIAENEMEQPPFFIAESEPSPDTVFNKDESYADLLDQLQDLKTAVFRQIITNVAKNNGPRQFVDPTKVDMKALSEGDEVVMTEGNPNEAIMSGPQLPLSPVSMDVITYCQNDIESQSGSTRYNQGLDSDSLNKTAHGVESIMEAAGKRMKHTADLISRFFVLPMFKYLILLNQKYMDDEQVFRLTDQNVSIHKDDLNVDFDLIVNVGQGVGTKSAMIQYIMVMIGQLFPQLQNTGVVTEKSWYEAGKKLLETMGVRNVNAYLLDPDSPEAQQRKAQAQQELQAQQQQAIDMEKLKHQFDMEKTAQSHINVNYEDIPAEAKIQALAKFYGIKVNTSDIMQEENLDKQRYISRWGNKWALDDAGNPVPAQQSTGSGGRVQSANAKGSKGQGSQGHS